MEFNLLNFGLLCTIILSMTDFFVEGSFGGHLRMPSTIRNNRLRGDFLEKLRRSRISTYVSTLSETSYEEYNYTQVLDHFGYTPESYQTFPQRYFIDKSNWGGAQKISPIFVWLGEEQDITNDVRSKFMTDRVADFKALVVYIEHRYYGTSMPFGTKEASYANPSKMGYFTSAQALADYATLIVHLKKTLNAQNCPVVVVGGSYGGMLAAWFRLKYPHIAIGAVASSAPILYLDGIAPPYGFEIVVTKDFRDASEICSRRINESWGMMDKIASSPQGLLNLSKLFNTCQNMSNTDALHQQLLSMYENAAQYNFSRVKGICNAINSLQGDVDTVSRIAAGVNYPDGSAQCLDLGPYNFTKGGWGWQLCSDLVFPWANPPGISASTIFPSYVFDIKSYARDCYLKYGAVPRRHWLAIEFGGHDIKRVLKDFGSNIIFSNGLRDPWSAGGVLENISENIVALPTEEGTHCLDIVGSASDDPDWPREQRRKEITIVQKWIKDYNNQF